MPPHLGLYLRAGDEAGEGKIRSWPDRYTNAQGWPPSDHPDAVRADPVQHESADNDRDYAFRAQGDPTPYGFPDAGRDGRPDDSGRLCRAGERFGPERLNSDRS